MSDHRSIVAELRALQEARKHDDPRIVAMVDDVRLIRTEVRGLNSIGNLSLGNSRSAVESMQQMQCQIDCLVLTVSELRADLAGALERIENMAQWAKTKGKQ